MYMDARKSYYIHDVTKDGLGRITGYELNSGNILSKEQTLRLVKDGILRGAQIIKNENGEENIQYNNKF